MKNSENNIVVGIPRALYYERYHILWKNFWEALDVSVMVSPETNREIIENGSRLTIDEACLSLKIFIGHVEKLIGTCDYVMIPRICNFEFSGRTSMNEKKKIGFPRMADYNYAVKYLVEKGLEQ